MDSTTTFADRLGEAQNRLANLKRQRGRLMMEGRGVAKINEAIAATTDELEALQDAAAEDAVQSHADRIAAGERHRAELREHLRATEEERLLALAEAEHHFRNFAGALGRVVEAREEIVATIGELREGERSEFSRINHDRRIFDRMVHVLRGLNLPGREFSKLGLSGATYVDADRPWAEDERRRTGILVD